MNQENPVKHFLCYSIVLFFVISCQENSATHDDYTNEINLWHQNRIERLKADDSWLSLAGLFWLKEGPNSFGSGKQNDIIFPSDRSPETWGSFYLRDSIVSMELVPDITAFRNKKEINERIKLAPDTEKNYDVISYKNFSWYVIKRKDRFGIRLKDHQHPNLLSFRGIKRFPVDKAWRVPAKFIPYDTIKAIPIPSVLGYTTLEPCPGYLEFEMEGESYRLEPVAESLKDRFFVIFADLTNGESSYGAGRFVYTSPPDKNNRTYIDFNRSYNPPCVFTEFATCPLPPPQNRLSLRVTAGEMIYEGSKKH